MERTGGYTNVGKPYFRKRRKGSPLTLLLIVVAVLVLIYLVVGLLGGGRARDYQNYIDRTNKLVAKSNKISQGFTNLKANVETVSQPDLKAKLTAYAKESQKLTDECRSLEPPQEMKKAHFYLTLAFDLRAEGLRNYKPALFNALKDIDLEVASAQVAAALKDLALSDRAYTLFSSEAEKVLKKEAVKAKSLKSKFLADDTAYEKISLLPYLQQLKGIKSLEEIHGLVVSSPKTTPAQTTYNAKRRLALLPAASKLTVRVVVENQGNQIEFNVPVVGVLKSTAGVEEQRQEIRIISIEPGEKKTVTLTGFKPQAGAEITNLLTVTAGPVPKEKDIADNTIEYKFIME